MDVNGTRFHLIQGQADWQDCLETAAETNENATWNQESGAVMLSPLLTLFPKGKRDAPLAPVARRGAAVDKFGNWYWISQDQQQIYWLPSGTGKAAVYWAQTAVTPPTPPGAFTPANPPAPTNDTLSGLAVTTHHYLVVGNLTRKGIFIFDLHAGGAPTLLLFPQDVPFAPFDMVAIADGGVWILDRVHRAYWGLDRNFRIIGEPAHMSPLESSPGEEEQPAFQPVGGTAVVCPGRAFPNGFPLAAPDSIRPDPISIVALPNHQVLILDNPPDASSPSQLYHYALAELLAAPIPLVDEVEVATVGETNTYHQLSVLGFDMAYTAHDQTLYVVERDGNQVVAFYLDLTAAPPTLAVRRDYWPMHFFGGRALVSSMSQADQPAQVYYDVVGRQEDRDAATRWMALRAIHQPRYTREATLETPIMDGKERDCVWHRLFLEACIPAETAVTIYTRAHNDKELLATVGYNPEPALYRRGAGPEIPYYQPFAHKTPADGQGTWELLLQAAHGRYLQIKLVLTGNGRVTPQLHALRAYYPRFSYPARFLPAVYQEEGTFLERLLANMEGIFTETEGKMVAVSSLFDARSAPPEALDWLAGWLGLMMDPLWAQVQANRYADHINGKPASDRRRLFIRYARILYERRGTLNGLRFALHLFLDPCLEATLRYFKLAAITPTSTLPQRLARYNLLAPTPTTPEISLENLLYDFVLARPAKIRIVEQFQTRGGRALAAGDPTTSGDENTAAHQFTVLIPEGLPPEEEAMVRRIINLEKPAHTAFAIRRYWDGFRVGEARLGIDTTLDESSRFTPFILGRNTLASGYLGAAHPFNVRERYVSDRDSLGHLPPL